MPIDPFFTSKTKLSERRSRKPKSRTSYDRAGGSFSGRAPESIELQLGRSDYLLGEPQSRNPFPPDGDDAKEWTRGWLREYQITKDIQATMTALCPPWKRKSDQPRGRLKNL